MMGHNQNSKKECPMHPLRRKNFNCLFRGTPESSLDKVMLKKLTKCDSFADFECKFLGLKYCH